MMVRAVTGMAIAATIAAVACGRTQGRADSAAVIDSAAASTPGDSSVAPAPGSAPPAAATSGAPNGAAKPATAASPTSMGNATSRQKPETPAARVPADTNSKPPVQPPAGATTPAYIVFRDAILPSDLDWLRAQGFKIVTITESTHGVRIAVPDGYSGNPKANPRVLRFTIAMR